MGIFFKSPIITGSLLLGAWLTGPSSFAAAVPITLQNPGMEAGAEVPEGWRGRFGNVTVTRDTATFHGGKASLSVQNTGSASGCGHQLITVTPGVKIHLGGWVKCTEGGKVNFAAQFFDEKFTWNEFVQVKHVQAAQDWQFASKEITVPENATRMAVGLYVEGAGRAWLDDITLTADGVKVELPVPDAGPPPPQEPADAKLIPGTPLPGYWPDFPKAWMVVHESHVKRAKEGGIDVLFLGDSLTQGWGSAGKETWDKNFAPLNAANFGIGGDKTGNVLWRLEHGAIEGFSPKLVVLMIGVNNLWSGKNTAAEIAGGIRAIVTRLRAKLPQTKLLVLGVLPIGTSATDIGRLKVADVNAHAASLDDGAMVRVSDFGTAFVQKNGALLDGAYQKDNLHLTSKGYEVLARQLVPVITGLLK